MAAAILALVPMVLAAQGTVPAGTAITVNLDQTVSSKTARAGQSVAGSVAHDVVVDGKTVIPKGSRATLMVTTAQASGRLSTPAKLWLRLASIDVHGQNYRVASNSVGRSLGGKAKRDTLAIGGGAAAGAIIGAIAGGGKGAAIGAGAGAGAGTVGAAATGKKDIEYPAETKLRFTTRSAITIQ
ncbi:MAG TPA: hypothetical protein VOA41_01695 [Candidatus Dormibacteraeota bacterium]|nr:hypothetical protein [Candidatus Dormibacteraeota bacterium]